MHREAAPPNVPIEARRAQARRCGCRKRSGQSQETCCPSMLVARKWGALHAYSAPSTPGLWEPAGGWRLERERSCPRVARALGNPCGLLCPSSPLPLIEPRDGVIHGAGESPGSPGWSGRLATVA